MSRKVAVAVAPASRSRAVADESAVEALRRRLASGTAREHVVLDFLEDDLREARGGARRRRRLDRERRGRARRGRPVPAALLSLALGGRPGERIDELSPRSPRVRRRLAQVAARM